MGDLAFDRFNFTTSYRFRARASASFKLKGAAIYFTSHGILSPNSDTYQATTDEKTELQNLRIGTNSTRAQFIEYWRSGLGPSKEHTVTISNLANTALNVDAFMCVKALYYCF